jgi:virulence-associated protein VapD
MRIIAHTKYGVFEGTEREYDETEYEDIGLFLEKLPKMEYFSFETDKGKIYFTEEMINDTLFILEK